MESYKQPPVFSSGGDGNRALPNATAVLVLGIISIPACICYGIVGVICAVIALIIARKDSRAYREAPTAYSRATYNNLNAGRICAVIGLILSLLYTIVLVWLINKLGSIEALQDPERIKEVFGLN